ncbi:MAG: N4-gp56 family major capsid protein [Magnetococcus sp. YQC-5]
MPTVIPFGSPLAATFFGRGIFNKLIRRNSLTNLLTGKAPSIEKFVKGERAQTSGSYPIVRITDLEQGGGSEVTMDMFNPLSGMPVIGDAKLAGKMMSMNASTARIRVDQMRGGVDIGGRMTQQRTPHKLRTIGRVSLENWWLRYLDQMKIVHLVGGRGTVMNSDWIIPLADHPMFATIMGNPVYAPTYNRQFWGGDATGPADMDSADIMTLDTVNKLRAKLDEADIPVSPIKFEDDEQAEMNPLYILLVTPRQWATLWANSSGNDWQTFLKAAGLRGPKNPLFTGDTSGMWNGILVKKMDAHTIRYAQGSTIKLATNSPIYTETTAVVPSNWAAGATMDSAILLGGQALGEAWGMHSESGQHLSWYEGKTDHNNGLEASVSGIGGFSKIRFRDGQGVDFDYGVAIINTYAPAP